MQAMDEEIRRAARALLRRIHAETRTGELLRAQEKAKGGDHGGRKPKDPRRLRASNGGAVKTLKQLGISETQSDER